MSKNDSLDINLLNELAKFNDHINTSYYSQNLEPYKKFGNEIEAITSILEGIETNSFEKSLNTSFKLMLDKELNSFFMFSSYARILSSVVKTLKNIHMLLSTDSFGDVLTLLRRYEEGIYIFIFFNSIENDYDKYSVKIKEKTKKWKNLKDEYFLSIKNIISFLRDNKFIDNILNIIKISFKNLEERRKYLNDFIHYNGLSYMNNNFLDNKEKNKFIDQVLDEIKLFTKIFILFCMTNCEWYCTSSDYVDYLEFANKRIEGLQYIVMPVLNKYIIENFNTVELNYIKNNSNLKFGEEADLFMYSIKD